MALSDRLGRSLRDLRISVTDRCNFRCVYCMPKEIFGKDFQFLDRKALLSFEEIERVARIFRDLGIEKIRLTGGEPLVRRNIEALIAKLAAIGGLDLTLTTNGSLLKQKAAALRDAGLKRVTVSLDSLDDADEMGDCCPSDDGRNGCVPTYPGVKSIVDSRSFDELEYDWMT